jgi:NitT/TauT family transport system ATP-binding protein
MRRSDVRRKLDSQVPAMMSKVPQGSHVLSQPHLTKSEVQPATVSQSTVPDGRPIIEARHLTKTYSGANRNVLALQDVNFQIKDGEFVCLVGPSGCGKSTLLKIIAGLLPYSGGTIARSGRTLEGPGPDVGMVFQAPVLLPWRTVMENVLLPTEFRKLNAEAFRERAHELLALVGLSDFQDRYPHELSGGMQQRAAIVRALVQDPPILLMDEPFGALDAMTREQMNVEVLRIWSRNRKTVVFVTHSIAESVFLADRVFVMTPRPGRVTEIIDIDLPRPRDLSIINTESFGRYATRIRLLLQAKGDLS